MSYFEPNTYRRIIGGVNRISGAPLVRPFEYRDGSNFDLDIDGSTQSRPGTTGKGYVLANKASLVGWWRMDEGNDNVPRQDWSSGWMPLTNIGTVTSIAGFENTAVSFVSGGPSGGLWIPDVTDLPIRPGRRDDYTVSMMVRRPGATASTDLFSIGTAAGTSFIIRMLADGKIQALSKKDADPTDSVTTTGDLTDAAWHGVVVTWSLTNPGGVSIFIDGVIDGTDLSIGDLVVDEPDFDGTPMLVNGFLTGAGSPVAATWDLDEFSLWDIPFTATEAATVWNSGAAGGTSIFADNGIGKRWRGIFDFTPRNGSPEQVGVCAGLFVRFNPIHGVWQPIDMPVEFAGPFSQGALVSFAQLNERLYFGNGIDPNMRYEGENVLFLRGLDDTGVPEVTPGLPSATGGDMNTDQGAGSTDWDIYYRILPLRIDPVTGGRFVYGRIGGSSSLVQFYDTVTPGATSTGSVPLTLPSAVPEGVTHWGLYRAWVPKAATPIIPGISDFVWTTDDIPAVAGGSFTDTEDKSVSDASGDDASAYEFLSRVPPTFINLATSVNRIDQLWSSGNFPAPNNLYVSDVTTGPDMVVAGEEIVIGRDDGDVVTGMAPFFDDMIIFKNDRFFTASPTFTNENFPYQIKLSNRSVGCESFFSIQTLENVLIWKDERGFYIIEGVDSFGNVRVRRVSNRISPELQAIPGGVRQEILSVHLRTPFRRHYRVVYTTQADQPNDRMWVYDYNHITPDPEDETPVGAWMPWSSKSHVFEAMATVENPSSGLDEVWFGDDVGNVFVMDTGNNDNPVLDSGTGERQSVFDGGVETAEAINSFILTGEYDHNIGNVDKRWRMMVVDGSTVGGSITVGWSTDYSHGVSSSATMSLSTNTGGAFEWEADETGVDSLWDAAIWGGPLVSDLISVRKRLHTARGHHIQLQFSMNMLGGAWVLHGWSLYALPRQTLKMVKG